MITKLPEFISVILTEQLNMNKLMLVVSIKDNDGNIKSKRSSNYFVKSKMTFSGY